MDKNKENINEEADITPEERSVLDNAFSNDLPNDTGSNGLETTDEDGTPLNEEVDHSGEDLDIPGADADDHNESLGTEDEENNLYSDADTE
jgi:hypothetical protein